MTAVPQRVAPAPVRAVDVCVTTADGWRLAVTLTAPRDGEAVRGVVIGSATGVPRGLYTLYARYLAARGCAVATFDFRGIGGSALGPGATILDWGRLDYPAVLGWMARRMGDRPLHLVGHSIGGQLVGMMAPTVPLASVCTVASQNAYYRRYGAVRTVKYGLLWRLAVPAAVAALGRFPAERLGLGPDLPGGVALDWARFATHPDYLVDSDGRSLREGFDALEAPILAYSFADDHRATGENVAALHWRYRRARVEHRHVDPAELGVPTIGHLGFFSPAVKRTLWADSLTFLAEAA
ncbi:MAG: alpha/beta fold hydrolase [Myxococcota bacterium]